MLRERRDQLEKEKGNGSNEEGENKMWGNRRQDEIKRSEGGM